jgi:hypothetical protein
MVDLEVCYGFICWYAVQQVLESVLSDVLLLEDGRRAK